MNRPAARVGLGLVAMSVDVAVNLLWCVPGQVGGLGGVPRAPAARSGRGGAAWRPVLFAPAGFAAAHPDLAAACEVREAPRSTAPAGRGGSPPRPPGCARQTRDAALRHHGGGTAPAGAERPYVLTDPRPAVPDVPRSTSAGSSARYLDPDDAAQRPRAPRWSPCPPSTSAATVIDAYGLDPQRVVVVPHGVRAGAAHRRHARRRAAPPGYALGDGPVLVYPAVTHPHKNHRVPARPAARRAGPTRTCGWCSSAARAVPRRRSAACLDRRVCRLGRVPAADRNGLMAHGRRARVPQPLRGLRRPADRGDGARHADHRRGHDVHPRGRRRRRPRPAARRSTRGPGRSTTVARRRADLDRRRPRSASRSSPRHAPARPSTRRVRRGRADDRAADRPLRLAVLCPHFEPDTAPTGEVITADRPRARRRAATSSHVVTALPWYRHHAIEPGWTGRLVRHEHTTVGDASPGSTRSPARTSAASSAVPRGSSASARSPALQAAARRPGRRRAGDVAAVHHGADRLGVCTSLRRGPARLQRPGRVPRRGDRHRGDHRPPADRRRPLGRAAHLPGERARSPSSARRCGPTSSAKIPAGPGRRRGRHPQLRRHRGDPPARPAHRAARPSSASATSRW